MLYLYVSELHESGEIRETSERIPEISPSAWKNRFEYGFNVWGEAIGKNVLPLNHAFECPREAGKVKAYPTNCETACIVWEMEEHYEGCRSGSVKCSLCREKDCVLCIRYWRIWGFFENPEKAREWAETHAGEWYIFPV